MGLRGISAVENGRSRARGDRKIGFDIVAKALRAPTRQIVCNGGGEGEVVVERILEKSGNFGYDCCKREFGDMVKAGIIDPTKVARIALESAASVAGLLLTTEVLVTDLKDEDKHIEHSVR